jgi:hypothetical protein
LGRERGGELREGERDRGVRGKEEREEVEEEEEDDVVD